MSDSKALKSKGSSEPVAAVGAAAEDEEEESEREASRAALPPFLYVGVVLLKKRVVGVWCAVMAGTKIDGLEIAIVSPVRGLRGLRWQGECYRKLHCLATATSRDSRREQSNCVDRVACIFGIDGSFFPSVATSKPRKPNVERP
jgi:hypothetical protein